MKTFVPALLVALAGVASAQLADLPQCSLQCFLTALGSDGCSELTDFKCHCEKSDALLASVTPCVQEACNADDQAAVISGVKKTCVSAGVPISVPDASSSAAPESSNTMPASTTDTMPASTTNTMPAYTTDTMPASTTNTMPASTTDTMMPMPSASGMPMPSANGTVPTGTPVPSTSDFPGAASRIGAAAGLVGAAALAVFAL